jgi:hypothetical protein
VEAGLSYDVIHDPTLFQVNLSRGFADAMHAASQKLWKSKVGAVLIPATGALEGMARFQTWLSNKMLGELFPTVKTAAAFKAIEALEDIKRAQEMMKAEAANRVPGAAPGGYPGR